MSCEEIQEQLDERLLAADAGAGEVAPALRAHLEVCAACSEHLAFLRALAATLAHEPVPPPPTAEVLAHSRQRAQRALRAHAPAPARGLVREVLATLAVLVLALPVSVAHAWLVAEGASALLAPILPHALLIGLGVVYFGSIALLTGALYAFMPIWVATVRRARREAT